VCAGSNAVDEHAELVAFKIHAIVADAETVQRVTVAFQLAEIVQFAADDVLRRPRKSPRICNCSSFGIRASSDAAVGVKMI